MKFDSFRGMTPPGSQDALRSFALLGPDELAELVPRVNAAGAAAGEIARAGILPYDRAVGATGHAVALGEAATASVVNLGASAPAANMRSGAELIFAAALPTRVGTTVTLDAAQVRQLASAEAAARDTARSLVPA